MNSCRTGPRSKPRMERSSPFGRAELPDFVERAELEGENVRFRGWSIDETAKTQPRRILVFAGGRLWADGSQPYIARADIVPLGEGYRFSGFSFLAKGLLPEHRTGVRVFAIMADQSASELEYSEGFPFPRIGAPSPNPLPSMESVRHNSKNWDLVLHP